MKKRTLFLAMTALMITMTSGGSLTAVYADEIPTEAAETSPFATSMLMKLRHWAAFLQNSMMVVVI